MSFLSPILSIGRAFNTAANVYLAGKLSWWTYKNVREMRKEKLEADQLKERFIKEYEQEHGEDPTPELVSLALRSYNAVENPLKERLKRLLTGKKE